MKKIGEEIHLDVIEARGGETPHIVRYVLAISLFLAIASLSTLWITAAVSQHATRGWPVTAEENALGLR